MKGKQGMRLISLLLSVLLVVGLLPTTALAEEVNANRFILVAESKTGLLIPPTYVYHTGGTTTVLAALGNSGFELTGLEYGMVSAIEGVSGNFTRSDEDGEYDFSKLASEVTHYCFSERSASDNRLTKDLQNLMTAMADYLEKESDVQQAAKKEYAAALTAFATVEDDNARTLAYNLNEAIKQYEDIRDGAQYAVTFKNGDVPYSKQKYPGISITAANAYGRQWEDDGDGIMEIPLGNYTFRLSHNGLSVSGNITISGPAEFDLELPGNYWLQRDTFRLSGSYGEETNENHHFKDEEFTLGKWDDRSITVPVPDSFSGAVYTYAQYDKTLLATAPTLTAVYTAKNVTGSAMNKNLPFGSLTSGANSVLARGAEGNTVIYRLSRTGADGYVYGQDYTVTFVRIPTLTSITVRDQDGTDQAPTTVFNGKQQKYTYKVLDSVEKVKINVVPLVDGYEIKINDRFLENNEAEVEIVGNTDAAVTVTANGYSNTYMLQFRPGEGKVQIFSSVKDVTLQVFNSNGVEIPYTSFKESDSSNRYRFTLVPGEQYSYIATYDTYYHQRSDFSLTENNKIIAINFEDVQDWLTGLDLGIANTQKYKGTIPLGPAFSADIHQYQVAYPDTESAVFLWVKGDENTRVQALYNQLFATELNHGKELQHTVDSGANQGKPLSNFLMFENPTENTVTIRLSKVTNGVTHYQDYIVEFQRPLTLKNLTAKCDDVPMVLQRSNSKVGFDPNTKEYSVKVSMAAQYMLLDFDCYTDNLCYGDEKMGYRVKVDGTDATDAGLALIKLDGTMETQTVSIQVENPKSPNGTSVYTVSILKSPPVETSIRISPSGALPNIREVLSGERIWPDVNGVFQLCEGYKYDYALTEYGYVSKSGTLNVTRNALEQLVLKDGETVHLVEEGENGGSVSLEWSLQKAPANLTIDTKIVSEWPNFRGDETNNAVKNAPIPTAAEEGTLYWAQKIGEGYDADAVGSPILVDGAIITYAGNSLFRIDPVTGEILDIGTMDHKSSFSITPPVYAEGMVFVALSNGCVQAFNAATLESLWIYNDPLGGQPNCPLTVKNGYLYTGFWNSETGDARFVSLSITDEDPDSTTEEKCASWFHTAKGGFYWAGAYVGSDFVLVGTDDGGNGYTSRTSRMLLMDTETGKLLDNWDNLNADIRSTVVYDRVTDAYYFTAKGGTFYRMQISSDRKMINKQSLDLRNSGGGIPMSTCSPSVYNGRAYIGVSGSSQFGAYSGHNITVIDLANWKIAYSVETQGYPQTSGLLTTAYQGSTGYVYVYFFDNYTPGKLRVLRDRPGQNAPDYTTVESITEKSGTQTFETAYALFTPTGDEAQYAICSPIVDKYGTVYFKNDSGRLMAFGSMITKLEVSGARTQYISGEKFDPTGMKVTATYANGKTRDVTEYVTYYQMPLTEQDTAFTISYPHVQYHNQENGREMEAGVATTTPTVTIYLNIGNGLIGDVDRDNDVDADDAQMILDYEAQRLDTELIVPISDVSGDGRIDSNDAVLISQFIANKLEKFPVEESKSAE